jgi:hypothetical protein
MLGADLLLVEEFRGVMPSKTLQYLRAGRPILGLLDGGGALHDVLRPVPQAHLVELDDVDGIVAVLNRSATVARSKPVPPGADVTAYSRREIARRFAELLEVACTQGNRRVAADHGSLVHAGLSAARSGGP